MGKRYEKTPIKGLSGKERVFDNGGSVVQITIKESSLEDMGTFTTKKGEKCFQFHLTRRREKDDWDNTHWGYRLDIIDEEESKPDVDWKKETPDDTGGMPF